MDSQESGFAGQSRRLVAPTPSSAAFPSSEETASHPDWLRAFTILHPQRRRSYNAIGPANLPQARPSLQPVASLFAGTPFWPLGG